MESIQNPEHPIPDEIAAAFEEVHAHQQAMQERTNRRIFTTRPTSDERQAILEVRRQSSASNELDTDGQARLRDLRQVQTHRVVEELDQQPALTLWPPIVFLDEFPPGPPPPPVTDRTFWWANSDANAGAPYSVAFLADGLHIGGKLTHGNGDLIFRTIVARARFEIQSERIPPSSIGVWDSSPRIELFGEVVGHVPEGDIFSGDLWSKCWLHLRQSVFQFGFGPDGPVRVVRGEANQSHTLIFIENVAGMRVSRMPGAMAMPSLALTNVNTANSLWAELTIQFDIQLEGDGSLIWLDPELILRTFQWPLVAL